MLMLAKKKIKTKKTFLTWSQLLTRTIRCPFSLLLKSLYFFFVSYHLKGKKGINFHYFNIEINT